ncbi:sensor histidine kinase [Comamonas flocculans]|uniref:histidine kinase n=1 Tax=Comamonas flocculans TaxID=2597701 RepID=A0A5B8RVI0_9BURK|nr:sensor histidine kinase [Comamonas flocculans]QEA12762.1 sensor histidine kinase [Comamonas flocculans]
MKGSLRWRLLVGTLAWVAITLAVAGWGLAALFREHVMAQWRAQLVQQLDQLSGALDWVDGEPRLGAMAGDARLSTPLSGWYWQIDRLGAQPQAAIARSRSLWDQSLALPAALGKTTGDKVLHLSDAQGHALLAVARTLELPDADAPPLLVTVAGDEALVAQPIARFAHLLWITLAILATGLLLAVALQLQLALRPLALLRQRLAAVRAGASGQLPGQFPQELQPLVAEFNHVLAENAEMVQRARAQAGNLAHAVNTPLAIIANAAEQDDSALALLVREQVQSARRQVDWHLARARATAAVRATGLATPVLAPLQALLRTMQRLYAGRGLRFELADGVPPAQFRGEAQDLYEMLGNLLDNAGKWARSCVRVAVHCEGAQLVFTIDDDGPGIPEAERQRMFERGVQLGDVRSDTQGARGGAGLGLDIVRSLAQTYGGEVHAGIAPLGGLRMCLSLPAST